VTAPSGGGAGGGPEPGASRPSSTQLGDSVRRAETEHQRGPANRTVDTTSSRPWPAGNGSDRRPTHQALFDWVTGSLVLVVYGVVQLAFLEGPQPFDSAKYFKSAVEFPDVRADLWTLRIGLVMPVRAAVLLFGPSEAALYAVPLAAGLVLAAAVYALTLLLFGDRVVAAAAALVTVLNTNYLLKSSSIFPDTLATATLTAGFLCLVLGARWLAEGQSAWRPTVAAVSAGVLFGWTYLAREASPLLIPGVLAAVVLLRYRARHVAMVISAALAAASFDFLYGLVVYSDPLVHVSLLLNRGTKPLSPHKARVIEQIQGQLNTLFDTMLVFPRLLLGWDFGWVLVLLIGVFILALVLRFRDRRLWLLAAWCFAFWLIMAALGVGSLPSGRWIVNVANIRYWYPILPPLVMGAFGGLALLVPKRAVLAGRVTLVHASAVALAGLALLPGLIDFRHCSAMRQWATEPAGRWHDLRSWFATPQAQQYNVVWSDGKTLRLLPAFTRTTFGDPLWPGEAKHFVGPVPRTNLTRSLVLVHKDRFHPGKDRLAKFRAEWSPVFMSGDDTMVMLAHRPANKVEGHAWWVRAASRERVAPGTCGRPYVRGP
jgi:hypothetical protein